MHDHHRGFTLLELLLALAIAGILFGLAVPSWKDFKIHLQSKLITESIIESLSYARLEALLSNHAIHIKPINNNYTNGWEVIKDNAVLKIYPPSPVLITNTQLSRKNIITFQPNGMSEGSNGSFSINNHYKVTLNRGGRAYYEILHHNVNNTFVRAVPIPQTTS